MIYVFEDYSLDVVRRELRHAGELLALEPQVFDLLQYLIANRDRVVSKDDLIAAVWSGRIVSDSAITSRITAVRQAIGDSGGEQRLIPLFHAKGFASSAKYGKSYDRQIGPYPVRPGSRHVRRQPSHPAQLLPRPTPLHDRVRRRARKPSP